MQFSKNTKISDIPVNAFQIDLKAPITFASEEKDKGRVKLTAYDGSVVSHWYWGNLAFDLKGMKLKKSVIPILESHDVDRRLGMSTNVKIGSTFELDGKFIDESQRAAEIQRDAKAGFPFECSLSFDPEGAVIEHVKDGETVNVNGRKLTGPGTLISKCQVNEVSVCVFGALRNTQTQVFTKADGSMDEPEKISAIEIFSKTYPDLYTAAVELGRKETSALFAKFVEVFKMDPAFVIEQFSAGTNIEDAKTAFIAQLAARPVTERLTPGQVEFMASDDQNGSKAEAGDSDMRSLCPDEQTANLAEARMNEAQKTGRIRIFSGTKSQKSFSKV